MKNSRTGRLIRFFLLLAMLIFLTACGKDEKDEKTQATHWEAIPEDHQLPKEAPQARPSGGSTSSAQTSQQQTADAAAAASSVNDAGAQTDDAAEDTKPEEKDQESGASDSGREAGSGQQKFSGKYAAFGVYLDGQYVLTDTVKGWSVELLKDGTGYLYLGEKHQGPVSEWREDGGTLTVKAGAKVFDGSSHVEEGVVRLDFGDGMVVAFAASDEVIAGLRTTTL